MNYIEGAKYSFKKMFKQLPKIALILIPFVLIFSFSLTALTMLSNIKQAYYNVWVSSATDNTDLIILNPNSTREEELFSNGIYDENDLSKIQEVKGVKEAALVGVMPIKNTTITSLYDTDLSIQRLGYVQKEFQDSLNSPDYVLREGFIPIILNDANFVRLVESWDGRESVSLSSLNQDQSPPFTTEKIDYNESDLINQEITIEVDSLDQFLNFSFDIGSQGEITLNKRSAEDLIRIEDERRNFIDDYYNYDILTQPLDLNFVISGIIDNQTNPYAIVSSDDASNIWQKVRDRHQQSRFAKPKDDIYVANKLFGAMHIEKEIFLDKDYLLELEGSTDGESNYYIPGLVLNGDYTNENLASTSTIDRKEFLVQDKYFFDSLNNNDLDLDLNRVDTNTIIVKVDDQARKQSVINNLIKLGYFTSQDFYDYSNLEKNRAEIKTIYNYSLIIISLILFVSSLLLFSKYNQIDQKDLRIIKSFGVTNSGLKFISGVQNSFLLGLSVIVSFIISEQIIKNYAQDLQNYFNEILSKIVGSNYNIVKDYETSLFESVSISAFIILCFISLLVVIYNVIQSVSFKNH